MLWYLKIASLLYILSMLIELLTFAVPSEQSQSALLKGNFSKRVLIKFVFGGLGIAAFLLILIYPWIGKFSKLKPSFVVLGLVLIVLGRAIVFVGSWTICQHFKKKDRSLLVSGIFKYSRNPILIGLFISLLGFVICQHNIYLCALSGLFYFGMHLKVLDEENNLFRIYGEEYLKYKRMTKRYL